MIHSFREARHAVLDGTAPREAASALVKLLTPEEKLRCLSGDGPFWAGLGYMSAGGYHQRGFPAGAVDRLGVPGFVFCDGPRGVVIGEATAFPVSMARAATWDPALEERVGRAIGAELRAVGATLFGGVCINLLRHPAWGRAQETYGEDPLLVGKMGVALSDGVQRHAMACVKHFAANSMENARFRVDVSMADEALHELFLPHFQRVVESGVASVMTAYNQVNGQWCGQHTGLLTQILREEWGFDGFVISDWIFGLRDAAESVRAGLDVEMPYRMIRHQALGDDPTSSGLSWEEIDACIVNVVSTCLRFADVIEADSPDPSILACSAHRSLAREVAGRSVVLLRNERVGDAPVLPLLTSGGQGALSIALFGSLADTINLGDGGSSDVWTPDPITICRGLRSRFGFEAVSYDLDPSPAVLTARAAAAEVAVVVVGYTFRDEGEFIGTTDMASLGSLFPGPDNEDEAEAFQAATRQLGPISPPEYHADREGTGFSEGGDRRSLRLPAAQVEMITQVASANPKTIVVIQAGSAVVISEWDHLVPCILQSWYGGVEAGNGLADVLTGDLNPSAKLPFSVPTIEEHLPEFDADADTATYGLWHGWWKLERDGHQAAYPFGFGLSYTRFSIEDPVLVQPVLVQEAEIATAAGSSELLGQVRCRVTNTGEVHGAEVVQLYGSRLGESTRPRLVGFARVELGPEESRVVELPIDRAALLEWDAGRGELVLRPGEYRLEVGRNAEDRFGPISMTCP